MNTLTSGTKISFPFPFGILLVSGLAIISLGCKGEVSQQQRVVVSADTAKKVEVKHFYRFGSEYCIDAPDSQKNIEYWHKLPIDEERKYLNDAVLCRYDPVDMRLLLRDLALKGEVNEMELYCGKFAKNCQFDSLKKRPCEKYPLTSDGKRFFAKHKDKCRKEQSSVKSY